MIAALHMPPSLGRKNAADLRLLHAEALGDNILGQCAAQRLDFLNLCIGEFRATVCGAFTRGAKAVGVGVSAVFFWRAPLQIFNAVVRLAAVLVVNLMPMGRSGPQEGVRDQAVDKNLSLLAARTNCRAGIPAHNLRREYPLIQNVGASRKPARCAGEDCPFSASDTPQGRYVVRGFKAYDGAPDFFPGVGHLTHTLTCNHIPTRRQSIEGVPQ